MKNFEKRLYPEDIAEELVALSSNEADRDHMEEYTDCLSWLLSAAENPYNHSYFAAFYRLLENIANY